MRPFLRVLSVSLFSLGASAATITLYEVAIPHPTSTAPPFVSEGASFTVSPIGVGEDGKTTYIEEEVLTAAIEVLDSDSTRTLNLPSSTFTYTIVEDASGLLKQASIANPAVTSQHGPQIVQSCDFQGTTSGSCVEILNLPGFVLTSTYSGSLIPAFTLTETASIPGQTGKSGALTRNDISDACQLVGLTFIVWATLLVA